MKLFLVSVDESNLNETIYTHPVMVSTDVDILFNLLDINEKYDTIVVTQNYVHSIGFKVVTQALISLYKILPYSLVYVSNTSEFDLFIYTMSEYNIIPISGKVSNITLDALEKICSTEVNLNISSINDDMLDNYRNIVTNYLKIKDDTARVQYISNYKDDLIIALNLFIDISDDNKDLNNIILNLNSRNIVLSQLSNNYSKKLVDEKKYHIYTKSLLKRYEDILINNSDKIDRFLEHSERVNISHVSKECNTVVFYFKEIEDVNFYRFFDAIYNYLDVVGYHVRAIIKEANEYIDYANDYVRVSNKVSLAMLSQYNKIVRYGSISNLIDLLLSKQFNLDVLLIYDRFPDTHVSIQEDYKNLYVYYIGKYRDRYKGIEIPDSSFISPYEGNWVSIEKLLIPVSLNGISKLTYETYANRHEFMSYLKNVMNMSKDSYI